MLTKVQKIEVLKFMQNLCAESRKKYNVYDINPGTLASIATMKFDYLKSANGDYTKEIYELARKV